MQIATVVVSSAQIKSLKASPVQLLPAPGPDKTILMILCQIQYKPGTVGYTLPDAGDYLQIAPSGLTDYEAISFDNAFSVPVGASSSYVDFNMTGLVAGVAQPGSNSPDNLTANLLNNSWSLYLTQNGTAPSGELTLGTRW